MANNKVPAYQVRHVDGVMHLTLQNEAETPQSPEKLRVQPPAGDED